MELIWTPKGVTRDGEINYVANYRIATVGELIEKLNELDPNLEVCYRSGTDVFGLHGDLTVTDQDVVLN